ncbi:MAG TPA: hypothetical protein VFA26_10305 [Gemmataceae bacterium]|nr:hypothetical protein [Gemmataceae bacterium]
MLLVLAGIAWLFAANAQAQAKGPPAKKQVEYIKVEIRGVLYVADKVETDLQKLYTETSGATIKAGDEVLELYLGDGKDILATAKKHKGKTIVVTGTLVSINAPSGLQRLTAVPLLPRLVVKVTGIKTAEGK